LKKIKMWKRNLGQEQFQFTSTNIVD